MKKTKEEIIAPYIKIATTSFGKYEILDKDKALKAMQDLEDQIREEYSDQEKQGWVKITSPETMPPYFEHVIVFGGEVHCRLFSKAWVALQPEEFVERTGISHWMPLPEPPKQ